MNSWFTVCVKYTKQLDDGTFKRVTEPYLLAAMTFTDAEARIYQELGSLIRGEFMVTQIKRSDIFDFFHYEDSDVWYLAKIKFESGDGGEEGQKAKKVTQAFLISAHSVKEATERLNESLGGLMIDYQITSCAVSPIVDIFPFGDSDDQSESIILTKNHFIALRDQFYQWLDDQDIDANDATGEMFVKFVRDKTSGGKFTQEADDERFSDQPWTKIDHLDGSTLPHDAQCVDVLKADGEIVEGMEFDADDPDYKTFSTDHDDDGEHIEFYAGDGIATHWRPSRKE